MGKIDFGKIDRLHSPQRIVSATFDSKYVVFIKSEKPLGEPKIIIRTDCIRDVLRWVNDESANKVYGFDCETDDVANVFNVSLTGNHVLLDFTDEEKVVHHAFLSIDSLRNLVNNINEGEQ